MCRNLATINMQSFVRQIRFTPRGNAFSNENETEAEEKVSIRGKKKKTNKTSLWLFSGLRWFNASPSGHRVWAIQRKRQRLLCDCCAPLTPLVPPLCPAHHHPPGGHLPWDPCGHSSLWEGGNGQDRRTCWGALGWCPWVSPHGAAAVTSNHRLDSEGTAGKMFCHLQLCPRQE